MHVYIVSGIFKDFDGALVAAWLNGFASASRTKGRQFESCHGVRFLRLTPHISTLFL
jgi:hypothetical protein